MRRAGEVVAGFRVERLLGTGGMGEVYLVQHPRLPRLDALKLLPAAASADHSYRERFQREADLAAQLDHDNVVSVYDRGEADGQLWIHMKYVDGVDAAAALRTGGPFHVQRALHVVTRVASALDNAHRHGLLHRDVKPANILLGRSPGPGEPERVFLTDFGIAKGAGDAAGLTPSGHFAASLDYAAPEQIQMRPLDGRTDQYALGCVLFQLLTGSVPFPGDGAYARMDAHLKAPVPRIGQLRPGLPPAVQSVLDRALAKDPQARYDSCGELAAELARALEGFQSLATPTEPALPAPRSADATETPPPQRPETPPPQRPETPRTAPLPGPPPPAPSGPRPTAWWRPADRGAIASLVAAFVLGVLTAFPPTSALSVSHYPGELATGRFAAGELPAAVLLLVAIGLQLTRDGHRWRSLLWGVALGAGLFAAVDSLRAYAFTQANPGGAYDSLLSHTNGTLPRAALALVVVIVAIAGVLQSPPRPKARPGPHLLVAMLLAATAVVLAAVAVLIGPTIQHSRFHQLLYGIPLATAVTSALLLVVAALTRRVPVLVASVTVTLSAIIAAISGSIHYPLGIVADVLLLAAAVVLVLASRRPAPEITERPPLPGSPFERWPGAPPAPSRVWNLPTAGGR